MKNERIIETYKIEDVIFELIEKPETIYAGKIGYASSEEDESYVDQVRESFRMDIIDKPTDPQWVVAMNIDYWKKDADKRGMMFAKEVATDKQPEGIDVYVLPASTYIKVFHDDNAAKLLGKEHCAHWELFELITKTVMVQYGYKHATNGAQDLETHNFSNHHCYAYIPVESIN